MVREAWQLLVGISNHTAPITALLGLAGVSFAWLRDLMPWWMTLVYAGVIIVGALVEGAFRAWAAGTGKDHLASDVRELAEDLTAFVNKRQGAYPSDDVAWFLRTTIHMPSDDRARASHDRNTMIDKAKRAALLEYHETFCQPVRRALLDSRSAISEDMRTIAENPKHLGELKMIRDVIWSLADPHRSSIAELIAHPPAVGAPDDIQRWSREAHGALLREHPSRADDFRNAGYDRIVTQPLQRSVELALEADGNEAYVERQLELLQSVSDMPAAVEPH